MKHFPPGRMKSASEFRDVFCALFPDLDLDVELQAGDGPLGSPIEVCGRTLHNRFAIHPMEGWDGEADGSPSVHTRRRWRHFGVSGAALIWGGEAFAVAQDGRANPGQLFQNDHGDVRAWLATLRGEILAGRNEAGCADDAVVMGLQLTHSGRFSCPTWDGPAPRIVHHHPVLDRRHGLTADDPVLTDAQLETIGERFVTAAVHARETGFDFVDVKCCHGYLLHELLSARDRAGPYGGSFENRTRLLVRIIEGIRTACPDLEIGCRLSICDVHPFEADAETRVGTPAGWDADLPYRHGFGVDQEHPVEPEFEEPFRLLELLQGLGVRMVNVSVGSPYWSPHLQRPAAYPPSDGYLPPEDPLHGVAFHLRAVRGCKARFPDLVTLGSGYSYLQEWLPHVAQHEVGAGHVDFVGLGRMVLSYPEMPADVLAGRPLRKKKICRTFSDCTTGPRQGMLSGCFPLDDWYRALPEAERLKAIKKELRGR